MNMKSLLVASCVAVLCVQPCRAVLIAYEGFDYPAGTITGANGGTGWTGSWAELEITTPGATYSDLTVSGNKFNKTSTTAAFDKFRTLATTLGTTDETVWFSFIGDLDSTGNGGFVLRQDFSPIVTAGSGDWWSSTNWGVYSNGSYGTSTTPSSTQSFLVMRIDFSASGNEKLYLWTNPTLGSTPDISSAAVTLADAGNFTINRVSIFTNTTKVAVFDEIRVGTTYADVAPANIPEPSAMMLGLGAVGVFGVWRRPRGR